MSDRVACDEAMMFPQKRLLVQDPELQQGNVEKAKISTRMGSLEVPWALQGGFATVYKFRTKSGHYRALRCFNAPMKQDIQFRYERIGAYFASHMPDISARFKYHDQGILIKESWQGQRQNIIYSLIEMDWIESVTLLDKVDELCRKLTPLERQGLIKVWHDADISPGTDWEDEIKKHLSTADIILLLVSANFIASEYCYSKEMMHAMERHERGEAYVIPIILRSVYWQGAPFGKLQVLPKDALPVTKWQDRDDALFDVAEGIRKVVEKSIISV